MMVNQMAAEMAVEAATENRGAFDTEGNLAAMARARGPLRRVLAALAARWVALEGWSEIGYARNADYARERLGVSARSLQEWARVGALLDARPGLEAALVSGRLPWSKVRLLARFATAEDEDAWIGYAAGVGVSLLERELRAVDRGALEAGGGGPNAADDADEPMRWVRMRVPAPLAFKLHRTRRYAEKVEGAPLSRGDVIERVTAEVVSGLPVALEADEPVGCAAARGDRAEPHCAFAGVGSVEVEKEPVAVPAELPAFLQPMVAGLDRADAFELDTRMRRAIRLEQRLHTELAPRIRQLTSANYEWKERYRSLAELAREVLGMSPSKLHALLRVERLGAVCPALRDGFRDGVLSWAQAQILAPLLEGDGLAVVGFGVDGDGVPETDWRAAWVAYAAEVTVRQLAETVARARLWRDANPAGFDEDRARPEAFTEPDRDDAPEALQTCARPTDRRGDPPGDGREEVRLAIRAFAQVARLFDAALCTVRRAIERETGRLPSEAEGFEVMLDHALASWGVDDAWLRRRMSRKVYAVLDRDDWRCVFPGCTSRRNLQLHHIRFRSAGGGDEAENLTTLCAFHHQRGVHEGRVAVRGAAPDRLEFELGIRGGRAPLARFRSGDRIRR